MINKRSRSHQTGFSPDFTDKLKAQGGHAADIAEEMQQREEQLFNK